MFYLDLNGNLEPLSIYLARPDKTLLGSLYGIIDESSASLEIGINKHYSLSFNVVRTEDNTSWYEYIQEGMYLFVEGIGFFKINNPEITLDGAKETKSVLAYSCDIELEDKTCDMAINLGKSYSMEQLVEYEDNETEMLLNPYTGVPFDWILLYNTLPEQLTALSDKLDDGYFGEYSNNKIVVTDTDLISEITDILSLVPRLRRKITYVTNEGGSEDSVLTEYVIPEYDENDSETITSYTLTSSFPNRVTELITFYTKYRKQLSLLDLIIDCTGGTWSIGEISGVDDGDYTFANRKYQFDINTTVYSFLTNDFAKTAECIVGFDYLNRKINVTNVQDFGSDTGIVIGYNTLVNSLNIGTEEDKLATRYRVSGGDDLDIARINFGSNYIIDLDYKMNATDDNGNRIYVSDELAAKYASYVESVEELRDEYISLSSEYEEYTSKISEIKYRVPNDDLFIDWSTYTKDELSEALTQYKNSKLSLVSIYKEEYGSAGLEEDGSVNETFMRTTAYWYDYEAYTSLITQVECAIATFPYYNDQTKWSDANVELYAESISSWETDWLLYGTEELYAKIETFKQNMNLLAEQSVIRVSDDAYEIKTWSNLTDAEKSLYGNDSTSYSYSTYMEYYNNMTSAQTYLNTMLAEIASYQEEQEEIQTRRKEIIEEVSFEENFTEDECNVIYILLRDIDYSNDNIFTTTLDDASDKIERMKELLDDAKEKLSVASRPQLTFSVNANNLLALVDFQPLWNDFVPGNYIRVQYKDNTFIKVRLTGYVFNPCMISSDNLSISFSNFTQSNNYYHDWASLLGEDSTSSSSSSSSSGSSSSSDSSGIDTITETLLTKLLNSETFGTRVTDVILDTIDVNTLTARKATFNGLASGTTVIDGGCIQTGYIIDCLYNGTNGGINNTEGSIINIETGLFNLGGGAFKYDGENFYVRANIYAESLTLGDDFTVGDLEDVTDAGISISTDGLLKANNAIIKGTIYATAGSLSDLVVSGYLTTNADRTTYNDTTNSGITIEPDGIGGKGSGGFWYISSSTGRLYANNADITGSITANSLTLGNNVKIPYGSIKGTPDLTAYIQTDGTIGNTPASGSTGFCVSSSGLLQASNAIIYGTIYASALYAGGFTLTNAGLYAPSGASMAGIACTDLTVWGNSSIHGTLGVSGKISVWDDLYVDGDLTVTGSYPSSGSDIRIKQDITSIDDAEDIILNLKPCQFKWKKRNDGRNHYGFIAQEVKEIADKHNLGVYRVDEDGYYSLAYTEFIAPHIKLTQKHNTEIDKLKVEIERLKKVIEKLEKKE